MTYAATILATAGLISYWRLGETVGVNAVDAFAGRTGTYVGSPALGASGLIYGDADKSVTLDGINDQITIPDAVALSPQVGAVGKISVEFWVTLPPVPPATSAALVTKQNDATDYEWYLSVQSTGQLLWYVNANVSTPAQGSHTLTFGAIHHVVGVYDAASSHTAQVYVDGVVGSIFSTGGANSVAFAANMGIGNYDGGADFAAATLDEVALYSTALSLATIQAHYAAGAAPAGISGGSSRLSRMGCG